MKKLPVDKIQVVPINEEKTIKPLVEQLNNLLDHYYSLYNLYVNPQMLLPKDESPAEKHLVKVLNSLEIAIESLCLRICELRFMLKTNQSAT